MLDPWSTSRAASASGPHVGGGHLSSSLVNISQRHGRRGARSSTLGEGFEYDLGGVPARPPSSSPPSRRATGSRRSGASRGSGRRCQPTMNSWPRTTRPSRVRSSWAATYVGGKPRRSDRGRWAELPRMQLRSAAMKWSDERRRLCSAWSSGGKVSAHVVPSNQAKTLASNVTAAIEPLSAKVVTDQATWYKWLPEVDYNHTTIDHSARVYVSVNVHTQTIDSFWSHVKCEIVGVHHSVSPHQSQGYLNEYVWRCAHAPPVHPRAAGVPSSHSNSPSHPGRPRCATTYPFSRSETYRANIAAADRSQP